MSLFFLIVYSIRFNSNIKRHFLDNADKRILNKKREAKTYSNLQLLKSSKKNQHLQKSQFKHLRLDIFLTFPYVLWVFEAHFLIKIFFIKKTCKANRKNETH